MDAIILLILLLIVFLFTCKGKFEKYSLNFPKINKLKCKCDLKSKSKVKEGFAEYKNSDKKYPNQLDRIYHIWKPINDVTAESFYENKYSYPFFPENGNAEVSFRCRMRTSSFIMIIAEMNDGRIGSEKKYVDVMLGACS